MRHKTQRRSFLQAGFCGLAGLSLGDILALRRAGANEASPTADAAIFVLLAGGASHIDTFDPKPNSPSEIRGEFGVSPTSTSGVYFSEHLPNLAQSFQRFSIVRSISHTIDLHEPSQKYVLTGVRSARPDTPSIGSVVAFRKQANSNLPIYAAIPALSPNAGELGQTCEPYNVYGDSGGLVALGPRSSDRTSTIEFQRRLKLLQRVDEAFTQTGPDSTTLRIRREAYVQAAELLQSDKLRAVTNLQGESEQVKQRYGQSSVGEFLLLARRMIEAGTRFVTVVLGGWDTHYDNFASLRELLPPADRALAALVSDLEDRGLLASTLVIAMGEFGRTPIITARAGRDHWPRAMSVLLAGGGIQGGRIIGKTDSTGAQPASDALAPEDVAFTILTQLGIDPATTQLPPTGRVLLTSGRRISDLF